MPDLPLRLLVVLPSWVGDAVMATPAIRLLRDEMPGAFIGALARPGIDQLLTGQPIDEFHVDRARGVMGPKLVASKIRPRRYDAALLLTNSFSTALITRLAFIPRRVGYDRDGRGFMLTQKLSPPRKPDGGWQPIPAVTYYVDAARSLLTGTPPSQATPERWWESIAEVTERLSLTVTEADRAEAETALLEAGIGEDEPIALLNPGANNTAKRWPAERFAALADHLATEHGTRVVISGAPHEEPVARAVIEAAATDPVPLVGKTSLGGLKALCGRARILITNDTGPRHIAAALDTPVVSLFGPTDPRWTLIHASAGEIMLSADPTLPPDQVADDHPDRCRIERIEPEAVISAANTLLSRP